MDSRKIYVIRYKDSEGNISERKISKIRKKGLGSIDVYCHSRKAGRTFVLNRVLFMVDESTGEVVNPWVECDLDRRPDGSPILDALLYNIKPALIAMKHFCKVYAPRFDRKRRLPLVEFAFANAELDEFQASAIDEWIKSIWIGDYSTLKAGDDAEYQQLLSLIPESLLPQCRETVLRVMKGSGRREISAEIIGVINHDFPKRLPEYGKVIRESFSKATTCPKCGHVRNENDDPAIPDYQCPACGIVYEKYQSTPDSAKIEAIKKLAAEQSKERRMVEESAKRREASLKIFLKVIGYIAAFLVGLSLSLRFLGIYGTVFAFMIGGYLLIRTAISSEKDGKKARTRRNVVTDDEDDYEDEESDDEDWDNWDDTFASSDARHPLLLRLNIEYKDMAGNKTSRVVDITAFTDRDYGVLLKGFCHLRQANRFFRSDRIARCIDMETGELIEDVGSFVIEKYRETPDYTLDVLLGEEYDVLQTILFVAKADGRFMAAEKKVACMLCRKLTKDDRLTLGMIDGLFKRVKIPTLHGFKLAVGRLSKQSAKRRMLYYKAAEAIVGTQKTVHPSERDALEYMQKRFALGEMA